ncbi:MAG: UDP-N-acetylglucosamine 2-epimerase (hydrolyzing) [Anaerolineaceae bacterium]|nr:MAG: UDP-N-acetylglucosamine 2-epimerase (hydrolyzing) [Anaerolineaceae bacterium]
MARDICVVVTARPSYSRIKTAVRAIEDQQDLNLQLVIGASALLHRYGDTIDYIERDGFNISARVYMVIEGENPIASAKSTGLGLVELTTIFDNLKPDVVITIADRYETLATAVAASYMNVPVAHVQGGEVTGSIDEKVRHAVTKLSNLHFVATQKAAERVERMGEDPDAVFVTGCPSIDLAASILNSPDLDFDPFSKYGGVGGTFDLSEDYLVVMQHPVTTEYENALFQVTETLHAVHETGIPTFWFWPNVDAGSDGTSKGIRVFREENHSAKMHFYRNMSPEDFLRLVYNSRVVVGNSSVGIRECSYLGVPVVNIGSRQEGRERGTNVMDVPDDRVSILAAIRHQVDHGHYPRETIYGDGKAGERIADLLARVPLSFEKRLTY